MENIWNDYSTDNYQANLFKPKQLHENILRDEISKLKQQQQINNDYTMSLFYVCVILFCMIVVNFVFLLGGVFK